jgi:hypothetical protein
MILAALAALAALGVPAQGGTTETVTIREAECYGMVQHGSEVESVRIAGLYVIERTAADGPFSVALAPGTAIACPRSSIVPAPNDWKVLAAGHPLYIIETGVAPADRRVGAIELSQGQFRYRMVRGQLTPDEVERVNARLNQFQMSLR